MSVTFFAGWEDVGEIRGLVGAFVSDTCAGEEVVGSFVVGGEIKGAFVGDSFLASRLVDDTSAILSRWISRC